MGDQRESELPPIGFVAFEDAESGEQLVVNTSSDEFRTVFEDQVRKSQSELDRTFRRTKVDVIEIGTGQAYFEPLMRFFKQRAKRFR
jgi:hypothetical protein